MFQHKGSEHWLSKQWLIWFTLLNLTERFNEWFGKKFCIFTQMNLYTNEYNLNEMMCDIMGHPNRRRGN